MIQKSVIVEKIEYLLASAKNRNSIQGIKVYEAVIIELNNSSSDEMVHITLKKLNHALGGMEAHGHFTNNEFAIVKLNFRVTPPPAHC